MLYTTRSVRLESLIPLENIVEFQLKQLPKEAHSEFVSISINGLWNIKNATIKAKRKTYRIQFDPLFSDAQVGDVRMAYGVGNFESAVAPKDNSHLMSLEQIVEDKIRGLPENATDVYIWVILDGMSNVVDATATILGETYPIEFQPCFPGDKLGDIGVSYS